MRFLAWLIIGFWLVSAPAFADDMTLLGVGGRSGPAAASYVGPGDVVALTWWVGMRAYSAATAGAAAVNICSESGGVDVTCEDELTSATTGKLVLGTVGSTCGSVTCTVKIWYDPTGNNTCASAPCNFTQTTVADRATFLITGCPGTNGQPCVSFNGSSDCYLTSGSSATSQPYSIIAVSYKTTVASQKSIVSFNGGSVTGQIGYTSSASTAFIYGGGAVLTNTAPDGALHSIQGIFNGSSSINYVDDSPAPGSIGSGTATLPVNMGGAAGCASQLLGGYILESGFATATISSGNVSALTANQRAFWGF